MAKATHQERPRRLCRGLAKRYPDAHCALRYETPLQLLIATILSAQCTDVRVNMVTPALFATYPDALAFAEADIAELEKVIQSTGFFRNKAKNIQGCCRLIVEKHGGQVPATMEELFPLPGVGRKTANVILGNAFGVPGITVDTHFGRLARRLRWTTQEDPVKVEQEVGGLFPRKEWTLLSHRLIWHGRRVCHARRPACGACGIGRLCPSFGLGPTDEATARKLVKAGPFS